MFLIGNKGEINMIKFKYAIHKQTKTVIPYETFLGCYKNNTNMFFSNQSLSERIEVMIKPEIYFYSPIDILTNDDFEIILWRTRLKEENERLFYKLGDKSKEMLSLMYMYDVKL